MKYLQRNLLLHDEILINTFIRSTYVLVQKTSQHVTFILNTNGVLMRDISSITQFSTSSVPGVHKAVFFIHIVFMRPPTAPHSVLRSSCAHRGTQIQGARSPVRLTSVRCAALWTAIKKRRSAGKRTRLEGLGKTIGITMKNCTAIFALRFNNHCHNTVAD
jgi:hypothetical protein